MQAGYSRRITNRGSDPYLINIVEKLLAKQRKSLEIFRSLSLFSLPRMGALRAEVEGLAAEVFLLEDLTLARSLIPNLEADLAVLADFPAPTQSETR